MFGREKEPDNRVIQPFMTGTFHPNARGRVLIKKQEMEKKVKITANSGGCFLLVAFFFCALLWVWIGVALMKAMLIF